MRVSVFAGHATLSRACLLVGHIQYIPTAAARHALSSFYAGLAAEHQQRAYYVLPRTRLILRDVCVCAVACCDSDSLVHKGKTSKLSVKFENGCKIKMKDENST